MGKLLKESRAWIIIVVVFVLIMTFFDRNNIISRQELKRDIRTLEDQRSYYIERIEEDSTVIERLKDDDYLEQYAREHYIMKKDSDVVFIVPSDR